MGRKEIAAIIRELDRQGFTVDMGGSGHWKVKDGDGRLVTVIAASPGDGRGLRNAIAVLRRAGFQWPPQR